MASSLRASLLLVVAATSMAPLAALAWYEATDVAAHEIALDVSERENAALAAATRVEAAALAGEDPVATLPADAYLLAPDGTWRGRDGLRGDDAALAAAIGTSLSGADATRAWARVPALGATVVVPVVASPPSLWGPVFLGVAVPLTLGAVLVAVVVTYRAVRPLARLQEASAALATGDGSRRVPEEGGSEVRALARTFNGMSDTLARQRRALEAYASEKRGDVEAVNFAIAHELREPLRSMRTLAAAIAEDEDPEDARRALAMLSGRLAHLERIVLDLMRYEDVAQQTPVPATVDLGAVVDDAAGDAGARVERGSLPTAHADEGLVREAFMQVLRNVVEHGGGTVKVTGRVEDGKAIVAFDDAGPGIPAARRDDAFHLFQRLRPDAPGTGIGLAIVRRVAALHGGDARLEDAPAGGTRLEFELAVEGPPPRPDVAVRAARTF